MVTFNTGTAGTGFWDTQQVVEDVPNGNRGEVIRVSRVTKGARRYVDIRAWFIHSETQELTPGKGVAIPFDVAEQVLGAGLTAILGD